MFYNYWYFGFIILVSCSEGSLSQTKNVSNNSIQTQKENKELSNTQGESNLLTTNSIKKFSLDSTVALKKSYWNVMDNIGAQSSSRNTVMYGKKLKACSINHGENTVVGKYNYPTCTEGSDVSAGSYDGDINGEHVIKNAVLKEGISNVFLNNFDSSGQDGLGGNAYILPIYITYSYPIKSLIMKPWGGNSSDPNILRAAFISNQRVQNIYLPDANNQQLQQVLRFVVVNKSCQAETKTPQKRCNLTMNFKTFLKGKNVVAEPHKQNAILFADSVQGGKTVLIMPFNSTGQKTFYNGQGFATSWGDATQTNVFATNKKFQLEISWTQFTTILSAIGTKLGINPSLIYGTKWDSPSEWYLQQAGYGQENYNKNILNYGSTIKGYFKDVSVVALP